MNDSLYRAGMALATLLACASSVALEWWWVDVFNAGTFVMFCVGEITASIRGAARASGESTTRRCER